jgi:hypothetical protein
MINGAATRAHEELKGRRGTAFDDENLCIAGLSQSRQVDNEGDTAGRPLCAKGDRRGRYKGFFSGVF